MDQSEIVIKPGNSLRFLDIRELWRYRDLFYFLVRREILVKYKQTILGPAYAVIQPLLAMIIFTLFFGRMAKLPNDNIPYPLFYYAALVPWNYFSSTMMNAGQSLVFNSIILKKVYFPRIFLPFVPGIARLVDFFAAFVFLILLMIFYKVTPGWEIMWLPLLPVIMYLAATGTGLWLTALNIKYRDVGFAIGFLVQLWMFASPVVYPLSMVPERYRLLYALNPMTGVIEGFRTCLVGSGTLDWRILAISAGVSLSLITTGIFYFNSVERQFADVA